MSFTPQVITGTSAEGDYIYYNATVVNNTVETDQRKDDPELFFQDTRQNPLIKDSSKYVLSVDNFTINGAQKNIPLWVPQIQPGTDINRTIYTISFGWYSNANNSRVLATIPITWIPENLNRSAVVPTTATPRQVESSYYYGYTYNHFVTLVNNALVAAWRDVKYKVTTSTSSGGLGLQFGTKCPFFEFDQNTGLFSLCQDANTSWLPYGTAPRTNSQVQLPASRGESDYLEPIGSVFNVSADTGYEAGEFSFVGMNGNLEGLISNFDTVYFGYEGGTFALGDGTNPVANLRGTSYTQTTSSAVAPDAVTWVDTTATTRLYYPEFVFNTIPDQLPGTIFQLQPPYTPSVVPAVYPYYIRDTQNYISTGSLWNPAASIVLVTSSIPVRFEGTAAPVELGSSNAGGSTASSGASQKVLLETPINAITADMWRGFIDYKPLVPLFSALDPVHDGIINLDVKVCWRSRLTNELVPMKMYNSSSFTMRLRFVRKSA